MVCQLLGLPKFPTCKSVASAARVRKWVFRSIVAEERPLLILSVCAAVFVLSDLTPTGLGLTNRTAEN